MSLFKKLKDVSIAKKLYFIVGAMAILIVIELLSLWFAVHTLSSVRAFVGAEGLWSKAQKDAVYELRKYNRTHNNKDFKAYREFMQVPLGDHITRVELLNKEPDLDIARKGFLQGRIHPDDIDDMINLFRRFHSNKYLNRSIQIWEEADTVLLQLIPIADSFYADVNSGSPSVEKQNRWMERVDAINGQLTKLEDAFSYTLGEGSRWLEKMILTILLTVAFTVEFTGVFITILVTRGITRDLDEIQKATDKIIKGDLNARAAVHSKNEIGKVAAEVNLMAEQMIASNKELEQVAYIASHDLQEPLMTIRNYVNVMEKQYKHTLDDHAAECLTNIGYATERMHQLVKDMLDYSRIGSDKKLLFLDCNKEVSYVLNDMDASITASNAKIYVSPLPSVNAYFELKLLFQNLISNAIKFHRKDIPPVIAISASDYDTEWLFAVKDNGIGIEQKFHHRIFSIFQKLHPDHEYSGTGIGLAHCKKIVEMHRGKIWLMSKPGEGSTFYFTIPKV
ncbi:MAG TPA: ATP-binding protein [Ferruginibacter sp.]|nr:ATP-binding protein [Ferruginibacter sp.]